MPEGSIYTVQVVFSHDASLDAHLTRLEKGIVGTSLKPSQVREDIKTARNELAMGNRLFWVNQAVFYRAQDEQTSQNIEKQLQDLFGETVPISNGGYVIIQHTEALHAIDVNSGKTSKVSNQEEAALKVNLDAAETIARQLRLRDIGGIIVIDFIDLKKTSNKRKLFDVMKKAMSDDRSKHTILPLSKFCLMQITRQRVRQELKMTKEDAELDQEGTEAADKIEKKIEHLFVKQNEKNLTLVVHPYLYSYFTIGVLSRQYKWFIKHRRWVKIEKDNNISIKDYVFLDSNRQIIQTKKFDFETQGHGEAKKLLEICEELNISNGYYVDIGASDGWTSSATFPFAKSDSLSWSAILSLFIQNI